jgi:hypothetical protein
MITKKVIAVAVSAALALVFTPLTLVAESTERTLKSEKDYVTAYCRGYLGGYIPNNGTIPDCIWNEYAIEYDWGNKWYECLTQAKWYAMSLDKQAGCVLIYRKPLDEVYIKRAKQLISHYNEPITLWVLEDKKFREVVE